MILGIALRDVMLALFTGILLNVEKPFRVGDTVRINDRLAGKVERITWRTTVLHTGTNETVYVPNLSLSSAVILNQAQPDTRSKRDHRAHHRLRHLGRKRRAHPLCRRRSAPAGVTHVVAAHRVRPQAHARRRALRGRLHHRRLRRRQEGRARGDQEHPAMHARRRYRHLLPARAGRSPPRAARGSPTARSTSFHLVQQVRLFRGLPEELCHRISGVLIEHHFPAGARSCGRASGAIRCSSSAKAWPGAPPATARAPRSSSSASSPPSSSAARRCSPARRTTPR